MDDERDEFETNKKRWARLKTVEYLCIEARPTRRQLRAEDSARVQIQLDWVSRPEFGACDAFQALQEAFLRLRGGRLRKGFYKALHRWAEQQGRDLKPEDFASEYLRSQEEGRLRVGLANEVATAVLGSPVHTGDSKLHGLARRVLEGEGSGSDVHSVAVALARAVLDASPEPKE